MHLQTAMVQASLHFRAALPELMLFTQVSIRPSGNFMCSRIKGPGETSQVAVQRDQACILKNCFGGQSEEPFSHNA